MTSNIYLITNLLNNKKYVGQSIHPKIRWSQHKYEAKRSTETNILLYNAMRKYGISSFEFKIIEQDILIENIDEREQYWISKLNTMKPNGYNLTIGGEGTIGYVVKEETKEKLSKLAKERYESLSDNEKKLFIDRLPKNSYDLKKLKNGYENWKASFDKTEKQKIYEKAIATKKRIGYDFYNFSFGKMTASQKQDMYDRISKNNLRSTPITMEDQNGIIIKSFHSIGEASRFLHIKYGYSLNSKNNIRAALDTNKTIYGYKWKRK